MMDLAINGGKMIITDDNKTIVSQDIADEINENIIAADGKETSNKPDITIKD